jgi:hypothetical protein
MARSLTAATTSGLALVDTSATASELPSVPATKSKLGSRGDTATPHAPSNVVPLETQPAIVGASRVDTSTTHSESDDPPVTYLPSSSSSSSSLSSSSSSSSSAAAAPSLCHASRSITAHFAMCAVLCTAAGCQNVRSLHSLLLRLFVTLFLRNQQQ